MSRQDSFIVLIKFISVSVVLHQKNVVISG
jgi:hypothetical protein